MTESIDRRIERLREIAGCVTPVQLIRQGLRRGGQAVPVLSLRDGRLLGGSGVAGLSIDVTITLRSEASTSSRPEGLVESTAYAYALRDRNGIELLAYHWHPDSGFAGPDHPHLHVSAALRPALPNGDRAVLPLDKLHLATGPVSLAAFVRTLIEEFGARPLAADWQERLATGSA